MSIPIHTAKMAVKWCKESSAGSRPTSGYKTLDGVKEIAADNDAPNTIQTTELKDWPAHTYIPGLRGGNGALGITVNDYAAFRTSYADLLSDYASAKADNKALWIEFAYPPDSGMDSYYFTAIPSELGFGGAAVDGVVENVAYLIRTNNPTFAAASTNSTT